MYNIYTVLVKHSGNNKSFIIKIKLNHPTKKGSKGKSVLQSTASSSHWASPNFCGIKWLGVLLPCMDGMPVHHRLAKPPPLPPKNLVQFLWLAIYQNSFLSLGEERHSQVKSLSPRTQHANCIRLLNPWPLSQQFNELASTPPHPWSKDRNKNAGKQFANFLRPSASKHQITQTPQGSIWSNF